MEQYIFDFDIDECSTELYELDKELKSKIFGQDHVIEEIYNTLKISYAGLSDDNKPLGSFLFLGSTGVGKTQLAIELANSLNMNFERFDMSEYTSKHSKNNLIGSDKGLIGYDEGGILTDSIYENPNSVILFDEIEKADKSVLNLFLQVLDYGILTNTRGEKVSFDETIIIFTSNLGANVKNTMGFSNSKKDNKEKEINEFLSPEFRARLNGMIEFNPLSIDMITNIVNKFINELNLKLNKKNIFLEPSNNTLEYLKNICLKQEQGARGIKKVIDTNIKQILANEILFGKLKRGGDVFLDVSEEKFIFNFTTSYRFFDDIDSNIHKFDDFEKASSFAKVNPGFILTNEPCGNGYIVKESLEEF
jgi:ATP-dependent Clp protease ATP-binding subunit ClpA